jgi:hypothetical protein
MRSSSSCSSCARQTWTSSSGASQHTLFPPTEAGLALLNPLLVIFRNWTLQSVCCRREDPELQQAATALEAAVDEAIGVAYASPQQAQTGEIAVLAALTLLRRSPITSLCRRVALWQDFATANC